MPQSSKPWLIRQYSDPSLIWAKRPFRLNNRHPKRLPLFRRPKSTNGGRSSRRRASSRSESHESRECNLGACNPAPEQLSPKCSRSSLAVDARLEAVKGGRIIEDQGLIVIAQRVVGRGSE